MSLIGAVESLLLRGLRIEYAEVASLPESPCFRRSRCNLSLAQTIY